MRYHFCSRAVVIKCLLGFAIGLLIYVFTFQLAVKQIVYTIDPKQFDVPVGMHLTFRWDSGDSKHYFAATLFWPLIKLNDKLPYTHWLSSHDLAPVSFNRIYRKRDVR